MKWNFSSCLCWRFCSLKRKYSPCLSALILWKFLSSRCSCGHLNTFYSGQLSPVSQYTGESILGSYSVVCFGRRALWKFKLSFVTPASPRKTITISLVFGVYMLKLRNTISQELMNMLQNYLQLLMILLNAVQTSPVLEPSLKQKHFFFIAQLIAVSTEAFLETQNITLPLGSSICYHLNRGLCRMNYSYMTCFWICIPLNAGWHGGRERSTRCPLLLKCYKYRFSQGQVTRLKYAPGHLLTSI